MLDKTLQVPDHEPTINDHPSYLDDSDDESCTLSPSTNPKTKTKISLARKENEVLNLLEDSSDCTNSVCSRCHKTLTTSSSSLGNSITTNSESGFSELSNNSSCNCDKTTEHSQTETECGDSVPGVCVQSVGESSDSGIRQDQEDVVRGEVNERCEFGSSSENLSSEDEALLKILDFPARVSLHNLINLCTF